MVVLASGCGWHGQTATVPAGGTIVYRGQSLETGIIRFIPEDIENGREAVGDIEDGKFTLTTDPSHPGDGVVPGAYRVAVTATKAVSTKDGLDAMNRSIIPEVYAHPETSGIKVEVGPRRRKDLEIELKDAVKKS
jgi:hypothetical protein